MDPLSVTASLLAVLGAASTAGQALEHLSNLRHASDQLIALINEVADLQVVLKTTSDAVEGRTETMQDCGSLAHIVQRADHVMEELNHLIHHDLVRNKSAHTLGDKPKASHTAFLRRHGKINSLRFQLRDIKLSLLIAVGTLTFADVTRLKLRICDVDMVGSPIVGDILHAQDRRITGTGRLSTGSPPSLDTAGVQETPDLSKGSDVVVNLTHSGIEADGGNNPIDAPTSYTTAPSKLRSLDEIAFLCAEKKEEIPHVRIRVSALPLNQCGRFCVCQCHQVTSLATPNPLGNLFGRLFIGYTGVPVLNYRACNRITCRHGRSQMRMRIAYIFPAWFTLRLIALTITKASTTFMWMLSFPVVTPSGSPMLVFASMGHIEKIQVLLSTNAADLNAIDSIANKSPLHVALQFRWVDLVSFLIQQGADMFVQDCNKKTPLDTYYENYFTTTTEESRMTTLLPLFEIYDISDHWNLKYIHLIILGCSSVDLLTYLKTTNEDIDGVDSSGRTALMWAAWRGDSTSASILLKLGANPQLSSFNGNSALIYATYGGSPECLRLLLTAGADINHTSHSLVTSAMIESKLGDNPAIAKVRIERGAMIEASRRQRFTPLYVAALTGRVESLIYLLACGATTNVESWDCSTPLSVSISLNNHRIVEELIKRGGFLDSTRPSVFQHLVSVAIFGDERTIQLINEARPALDVSLRDAEGRTAQDRLKERLHGMDATDLRKERLAEAFQKLIETCSEEYDRTRRRQRKMREIDEDAQDPDELFHDALEN